jgi:hypothetical protein
VSEPRVTDPDDEDSGKSTLNDRLLDVLVYVPAGLAISVVDQLPKWAEVGRQQVTGQVSSARAIGSFVVQAGRDELSRRSGGLVPKARPAAPPPSPTGNSAPRPSAATAPSPQPSGPASRPANGHVPAVSSLSIPGFDTLSASQVVQRLDGLNRTELVSVRAYEASTRGRRTILNRIDQLLDERS